MCGLKPCRACEAKAHKISGTMRTSKVSFTRLGGMAVGYAGSRFASKKVAFLQTTMGGVVKAGLGIGINMYAKNGSFLQGVGDGVFVQGVETVGTSAGVLGLAPGRLGLSAEARMRRLGNAIEGNGSEAVNHRQKMYAKVV